MTELEIAYIDSYIVPGNIGKMIIDIVFKNNTPNYIQIVQSFYCGTTTIRTILNPVLTCIPSFATSGYYLYRSNPIPLCTTTPPPLLNVYRCGTGASCPTLTGCGWADVLAIETIPVSRVVTTIPTNEEVLAKAIPVEPPLTEAGMGGILILGLGIGIIYFMLKSKK